MKYKYTFVAYDFDLVAYEFTKTFDKELDDHETQRELDVVLRVNKALANVSVKSVETLT